MSLRCVGCLVATAVSLVAQQGLKVHAAGFELLVLSEGPKPLSKGLSVTKAPPSLFLNCRSLMASSQSGRLCQRMLASSSNQKHSSPCCRQSVPPLDLSAQLLALWDPQVLCCRHPAWALWGATCYRQGKTVSTAAREPARRLRLAPWAGRTTLVPRRQARRAPPEAQLAKAMSGVTEGSDPLVSGSRPFPDRAVSLVACPQRSRRVVGRTHPRQDP